MNDISSIERRPFDRIADAVRMIVTRFNHEKFPLRISHACVIAIPMPAIDAMG